MTYALGNGIVIGVVEGVADDDSLGRVTIRIPSLHKMAPVVARLVSPMAGNGTGIVFRPEPGEEVLVAFEHGDPSYPYILGALWGQKSRPPADDGKTPHNNWRFIRSRSGHLLKFDDTPGSERIEIVDSADQRRLVIDASGKRIEITATSGDVAITATDGQVTVTAKSLRVEAESIEMKAKQELKLAAQTVEIEASQGATVKGGSSLKLQASMIDIN